MHLVRRADEDTIVGSADNVGVGVLLGPAAICRCASPDGQPNATKASRHRHRATALTWLTAALLFLPLLEPGAASGASASVDINSGVLTYTAAAGEVNALVVLDGSTPPPQGMRSFDLAELDSPSPVTITAGSGCVSTQPPPPGTSSQVTCSGPITRISIAVMDRGDYVEELFITSPPPTTITAGEGTDCVLGSIGPDSIDGGLDGDVLIGNGGDDHLVGGIGDDQLVGDGTEASTCGPPGGPPGLPPGYTGGAGKDTLEGEDGNDTLEGGYNDDVGTGGAGDDTYFAFTVPLCWGPPIGPLPPSPVPCPGTNGSDTFEGGPGVDKADYSPNADPLLVSLDGAGNDGEASEQDNIRPDVEQVAGGSNNDTLVGSPSNEALSGGPGDDTLLGGSGADSLGGGAGADTVTYADRGGGVLADLDGVADDGASGEGDNVGSDVENLIGSSGDDGLAGNSSSNRLSSGPGNDMLNGGGGQDILSGGDGVDTASYTERTAGVRADLNDTADDGEPGESDHIAADIEGLLGGMGNDTLVGNSGANMLAGGPGSDTLDGGTEADSLIGGPGSDTASYASRRSPIRVTLDNAANDGEGNGSERDQVGSDIENVVSGIGPDTITGSNAANRLEGGPGEDFLDGGGGRDELQGGAGVDALRSRDRSVDAVPSCGPGVDFVIADPGERGQPDCERVDNDLRDRPIAGRQVTVEPEASGLELQLPEMNRFVPLLDHLNLPVDSTIDATLGTTTVTSTAPIASRRTRKRKGKRRRTQSAKFKDGVFKIRQRRSRRAGIELRLEGGNFAQCGGSSGRRSAFSAAKKDRVRRLWGNGKGRFSTRGRYSATTVRGTLWIVEDRCDGTLTRVRRGSAAVLDFRRKRTIIVGAGERYLAKAPRR